ncbi:hypothetical protein [Acidimangrovimonas pyrenivorans]|uniref:Cytochrome-c oxidase n=1 Tax=Acidimangrovimonas pyrenivorans TaxID=2030798 RepID=A0ABV7AIN8_9RHOB
MKGISFWFFFSGVVYVTLGMAWGIEMGMRHDFQMAPAHAHLNLVGWVTMALFGVFYHLVPNAAESGLAKLHFAVATLGVWLLVPGIAMTLKSGAEGMAIAGALVTLASMLIFLLTVVRSRA